MAKEDLTQRPDWLAPLSDPKSEIILRAAFDVFQEHGLHNATMLEVATRAHVSKETIYARFDSKEDLFYALIAWGTRQASLDESKFAQGPVEDPVEELRQFCRALVNSFMHPESLACYRMAISESGRNPEIGRTFDELGCSESNEALDRVFGALRERKLIDPAPEEEMRDTLIGLLRGNYHHNTLSGSMPVPSQEMNDRRADRCVALFLRAYGYKASTGRTAAAA
jgi:AcrR family transcriptional regulator